MNNKIVTRTITNAIFLAMVLITGTITAIYPFFSIIGVNAQGGPEYYGEMDNRYNSYEPEYSKYPDNNYKSNGPEYPPKYPDNRKYNSYEADSYEIESYEKKSYRNNDYQQQQEYSSYQQDYKPKYQSYEKDNYKSKKDDNSKSVSINKIKCINNNVNINGNNAGNVSIGHKGTDKGYLGGYSSAGGSGYGGDVYGKQGKGFECIINNNNNNTNVVTGSGQPPTNTNVSKQLPDLTINITSLQNTCPTGQGSCLLTVEMNITNLSNEPVNTPFNIQITTDSGLSTIQTVPFIPGSTSQTVTAILGPGNNCYDPNCQIDAFVDSSNTVIELDETNNEDSEFSFG